MDVNGLSCSQSLSSILLGKDSSALNLDRSSSEAFDSQKGLIFVDQSLSDFVNLASLENQNKTVYILNQDEDGITKISQTLALYKGIDSIEIISHGNSAFLKLGSSHLNSTTFKSYREDLQGWSNSLVEGADLLFFGCNLAADPQGKSFVDALAILTGADVAASTDLTGSRNLGGDWELEYQTGAIDTEFSFPDSLVDTPDIALFTFDKAAYTAASVMDFTALGYTYDKDTNLANGNRFGSLPSSAAQRTGLEVRKNAAELTPTEINVFINAVKTLKSTTVVTDNGITTNVYDQFVATHTAMRDAQGRIGPDGLVLTNPAHVGNAFLPWHRAFLDEFEEALQKVDPNVTIPYWDWTNPSDTFGKLFQDSFLGPNGTTSSGDEVLSGPFSRAQGWQVREDLTGSRWNGIGTGTVGLTRRFGGANGTRTLGTTINVANALNTNSYRTFRNRLEAGTGLHNNTHNWVGGLMGNVVAATNDPVFWMLHANVDRIWAEWQLNNHWGSRFYPLSGQPYGHNLNDPLFPWDQGGITIAADLQDLLPNLPKLAAITSIIDDIGSSTGIVERGASTDDTDPLLIGSLSNPLEGGEVLVVYRDGIQLGSATVNGTEWSYSDTSLSLDTTYTYTTQVIESGSASFAGNRSPLSEGYIIHTDSSGYASAYRPVVVPSLDSPQFEDQLTSGKLTSTSQGQARIDPEQLTSIELRTVIDQAIHYWASHGTNAIGIEQLKQTQLIIDNLGGDLLGQANPLTKVIKLDDDAAGQGWSISFDTLTPTKVDLLSILAHEFGHILGYDHSVMGESLGPGERRLPLDFKDTTQPLKKPTYPKALIGVAEIPTDLTNSGVVSPGNSIGRMHVQGDYQQLADSALTIEIAGRSQGQFDVLEISGHAIIAGTLKLYFLDDFEPQAGDSFELLKSSAIHGKFDQINVFGLNYGYDFELEEQDGKYILRVLGPKGSCQIENSEQTDQDCSSRYRFSSHGFASTRAELTADRQGAVYNPAFGEDLITGHYLYQFHGEHDGHQTVDADFFVPITQQEPEMLASILRGESPPEWAIAPLSESQHFENGGTDHHSGDGGHSPSGESRPNDHHHASGTDQSSPLHRNDLMDGGGHNHPLNGQVNHVAHGGDRSHGNSHGSRGTAGQAHHQDGHDDASRAHDHGTESLALVTVGSGHQHDDHHADGLIQDSSTASHDHSPGHAGHEPSSGEHVMTLASSHDSSSHDSSTGHPSIAQTSHHRSVEHDHSSNHLGYGAEAGEDAARGFHSHRFSHLDHGAGVRTIALSDLHRSHRQGPVPSDAELRLIQHDHASGEDDLEDLLEDLLLKSLLIALTTSQISNSKWTFESTRYRAIAPKKLGSKPTKKWPQRIRVRLAYFQAIKAAPRGQ
jgi:tyrosinase